MRGFRDTLEAYGVDYQTTMDRFLGNETLYRSLLDRLFEDDSLQKLAVPLPPEIPRRPLKRLIRSKASQAIWA